MHDLERGRKTTRMEKVIAVCRACFDNKGGLIIILTLWVGYAALRQHGDKLVNMTTLMTGKNLPTTRTFRRGLTVPEMMRDDPHPCDMRDNYFKVGDTIMSFTKIVEHGEEQVTVQHGGKKVRRWKVVTLEYMDVDLGVVTTNVMSGFESYCSQHLLELRDLGRSEL